MAHKTRRMKREYRTIEAMMALYCMGIHGKRGRLCPECLELLEYAQSRLDKCPFQESKPICVHCPVHCYKPDMRERIRSAMKYAGPRMLCKHPFLALLHLMDTRRNSLKESRQGNLPKDDLPEI